VRISPFDRQRPPAHQLRQRVGLAGDRRPIQIEILDKDLKIDTYRASGAGGQHVNRTDSAVRITHMPTGLIAACQNDRSQHRNRAQAMDMLRAKLYEREVQIKRAESDALEAQKLDTTFGSQIRNYVLHPYRLVKDLRTGVESGNPQAVLDGDLDRFLEAALAQGAGNRRPESAEA
jgi:peptide chain release factor 2